MKFAIAALLGAVSAKTTLYTVNGEVAYEEPEEMNLQINDWHPGQSGTLGAGSYERVTPARFSADSDDIFMRSMIATYAIETNSAGEDEKPVPSGKFVMDKAGMKAAAAEVLCTHKQICKDSVEGYFTKYFEKAWNHFDVNGTGSIEVIKTPQFMRLLASDQWMAL